MTPGGPGKVRDLRLPMSTTNQLRVTVNIDGGARGNPGPAGAGVVVRCRDDGTVLHEAGVYLGRATNNVAEYNALLVGLKAAKCLGATDVVCLSDSELVVRQMKGEYRVKNDRLRGLYEEALHMQNEFERFSIRHVGREQNKEADQLVNRAINLKRNVEDLAD